LLVILDGSARLATVAVEVITRLENFPRTPCHQFFIRRYDNWNIRGQFYEKLIQPFFAQRKSSLRAVSSGLTLWDRVSVAGSVDLRRLDPIFVSFRSSITNQASDLAR
jgi:hypothetical protein